jgi:DNA-directed RNA polymerase subunit H (RpoH/RPB5)/sRNA-binding regulator protein Hfq
MEMLTARGYTVFSHKPLRIIASGAAFAVPVHVFFVDADKLNIKLAKHYYYIINTEEIRHCILIYKDAITSAVRTTLTSFYSVRVELFMMRELQFNILTHELVPHHSKITKQPGEEYQKYPVMKTTDAVARFLGYQAGDVVRIVRRDKSVSYRIVK